MDNVHRYISSTYQLQKINACRLYLQAIFLSEITSISRDHNMQGTSTGKQTDLSTSKYKWSIQQNLARPHGKFRKRFKRIYCSYGLKIQQDKN